MGEIGRDRREFLYDMQWWEVRSVIRGYRRRRRDLWSATRWHAITILQAMPYFDLKKAGIHNPTDLILFPWDNIGDNIEEPASNGDMPTRKDIEKLRRMMQEENARAAAESEQVNP